MEVNCEGCAGCCVDWRPLTGADAAGTSSGEPSAADVDHERRGRYEPLDDTYDLVPLRRDEVRAFVDAGYGDALQPRLFEGDGESATTVDGVDVAAIGGRPAFFVGLRKPPKPVAPFGRDPTWLSTCVFLDPTTLQCRIHGDDLYPATCERYPGENLALDVETECERVERVHGGDRLRDDEAPVDVEPLLGPGALGATVFAHPDPERLTGAVERLLGGGLTSADRAEFVAVATATSPGTLEVNDPVYERTREQVLDATSWAGRAIDAWTELSDGDGSPAPTPSVASVIEDDAGAPGTPGWDADE